MNPFHKNVAAYIRKHDIYFGTPLNDPIAGIPIGDGDTGSLIWFESDGIHIHVNKTDLWNNDTINDEVFCSGTEENLDSLRHGGEIVIRFSTPLLDMIYQNKFDGRLSLSDASAKLDCETPFSKLRMHAFASSAEGVTALKVGFESKEDDEIEVNLLRFGSRNFWRWYARGKKVPEVGLDGTEAKCDRNQLLILQELNGTRFCFGLRIVTDSGFESSCKNSHSACTRLSAANQTEFTLFYNISLGATLKEAEEKCRAALLHAESKGYDQMFSEHKADWEDFWNKSFISISDDYLENLWYLSLYYSQSECRGAYPPHFTSGIWGFRHDYIPWNYYFHYNMQHMYAPLEASGHGDLVENYYRMRRNALPIAYKYAEKVKNKKGAFYHDVTDRFGRGARYDSQNLTPGPEIALAMYRHYRMNGDEDFLRNSALPVMKGVAEFYLDTFVKETDGLYHIHDVTAYEGTPLFHDTITDISAAKALFGALLSLPDGLVSRAEKECYGDLINHLPPFHMVDIGEDEVKAGMIALGIGKGEMLKGSGKVLTIATDRDGNPVRRTFGDKSKDYYGFPDTEMSPLYPSGILGIKDRGSEIYNAINNDILLHHEPEDCAQWCMMPFYLARMGLARLLFPHMRKMADAWLLFPNGFSADSTAGRNDLINRLNYNNVKNVDSNQRQLVEGYGFRHFDMETLPIIAGALNEALLQSYDGSIRLFPAIEPGDSAAFTLYAEGGFRVSAQKSGEIMIVYIESLRGENCTISLPVYADEAKLKFIKNENEEITPEISRNEYEIFVNLTPYINKYDVIAIANGEIAEAVCEISEPNSDMKCCGNSRLGTPKLLD